jgi:arylsulfatase A-like enzyme
MAVPWAWAFDTPFKWVKQVASHFGGTRQGMVISWPGHINDPSGIRSQFHHMIDIVPTILEATGIQAPETVDGIKQKPIEGVSMVYTFDKANAKCAIEARYAVFRDVREPWDLSRRMVCLHDATRTPLGPWDEATATSRGIQVGTLQHRRRLFPEQRPRGQESRQA